MKLSAVLALLLTTALHAEPPADGSLKLNGKWVGPLELTVTHQGETPARGPVATRVSLKKSGQALTGTWESLAPNRLSGTLAGTVTPDGTLTLVVSLSVASDEAPKVPSGCTGSSTFTGKITPGGLLRWTGPGWPPSPARCPNFADLVWTLQRP